MKTASVKEVKDNLSSYIRKAKKENVVITKNGRPTAILHSFDDEEELEDYLLEHDIHFIRKIDTRWRRYLNEGGVSLKQVLRQTGVK